MAFDPDEYLNETGTSSTATAEFDPDAYLKETEEQEAPFDPDAYLGDTTTPEQPTQPQVPVGTSIGAELAAIPQAFIQGVEQPTEAMGETAEVLGMPSLGATLRGAIEAPEGYVSAAQRFMQPQEGEFQIGGFAPQFLPRAIVEQAGQIAGAIATRAAGGAIGGLAGSAIGPKGTVAGAVAGQFLGPALFEMSQIVGPVARERAANQGRETPNGDDLGWAWATAGASGALNAIGARYLPNGDKLAGGLAKRISQAFIGEGIPEGGQAAVQQIGETFLTEQGLDLRPKEIAGEALIGGGAGAAAVGVAAPFTKASTAAETKVVAEQAAPLAPETAQVVSEQANQVIVEAQAEETAETPEQRVARLQREAQEAAGEIELEEEGAGLPPQPVTPTPEAPPVEPVAPVGPVVPAEEERPARPEIEAIEGESELRKFVRENAETIEDFELVDITRGEGDAAAKELASSLISERAKQRLKTRIDEGKTALLTQTPEGDVFANSGNDENFNVKLDLLAEERRALSAANADREFAENPEEVANANAAIQEAVRPAVERAVSVPAEGAVEPTAVAAPTEPVTPTEPTVAEPTPAVAPRPAIDVETLSPNAKRANRILNNTGVDPETAAFVAQQYQDEIADLGGEELRAFILDKFEENGGVIPAQMRYSEDQEYYELAFGIGPKEAATLVENAKAQNAQMAQAELEQNKQWRRKDEQITEAQQGVAVAQPEAQAVPLPAGEVPPSPAIEGRGVPLAAPEAAVTPAIPQLEPLRRVARAEQTEEDVAGLVDSGFVEVYNGQPVITQAGLEALPEAERPRLTPEARKIQIDTRTSEAAAEAISKNLRIGVDQVPVDVRMPSGWTLVGGVYVPPQPQAVTKLEVPVALTPTVTFQTGSIITRNKKQYLITDVAERTGEPSVLYVRSLKNGKPFGRTFFYRSNDPKIQTAPTPEVREARREPAITPQQDRDYLDAVERGDLETAQRVAENTAKSRPDFAAEVYHGVGLGRLEKNRFDVAKRGTGAGGIDTDLAFFFSKKKGTADIYAGIQPREGVAEQADQVDSILTDGFFTLLNATPVGSSRQLDSFAALYEGGTDPFAFDERFRTWSRWIDDAPQDLIDTAREVLSSPAGQDPNVKNAAEYAIAKANEVRQIGLDKPLTLKTYLFGRMKKITAGGAYNPDFFYSQIEKAWNEGYDILEIANVDDGAGFSDTIYAVRNPEQIKSADPVTYDDAGNIIPPSQRFQPEQADIRYARREPSEIKQQYAPKTDEEQKAFDKASSNKVLARNPQLAVAAVRMKNGEITAGEYADLVDVLDPFVVKGAEPIPSDDKIKQYIQSDKVGKVGFLDENGKPRLNAGDEYEFRIDIPTYNRSTAAGDTVYAITAHLPVADTAKTVGEVAAFTGIAKVTDPRFMTRDVREGGAITIAMGAGKFRLATVKGNYEPITDLPADINDPNVWTEVGYNPVRSSFFVDTRSKQAVVGGTEAIMVGSRVFVKNAQLEARPTGITMGERYARRVQMGRAGMEQAAVEARLQELGFLTGGIIRVVNQPDADFEGRTIILDGKVTGIELNASALKDNAAIDRVLNHEFAESANADGALNKLVERLTPKEKKEINDTITRLRYEERARTSEEAARAIETLAEAWKGRGFFTRAVARVEAWASKLGFKLTRRAAEYIAARNLAEVNENVRKWHIGEAMANIKGARKVSFNGLQAVLIPPSEMRVAYSIAAYHGTPHVIKGGFQLEKIGTGEGAQAYGWGLYFAENIDVAREYQAKLSRNRFREEATKVYNDWKANNPQEASIFEDEVVAQGIQNVSNEDFAIELQNILDGFGSTEANVSTAEKLSSRISGIGNLYSVDLDIENDRLLDWDSVFAKQSDFIKNALQPIIEQITDANLGELDRFTLGAVLSDFYRNPKLIRKGSKKEVSEFFASQGIQGIKYLDRASRFSQPKKTGFGWLVDDYRGSNYFKTKEEALEFAKKAATSNFVVFDENLINITGLNGQPVDIRESRREPEAIPTFTEGTPEAATLKEMAASMAKVDAASEAKGGKPETYKISEIASVWMDSGLGERELQDAIVEYTNLTPANAKKVASAIAKQYGLQQQIAETGAVIAEIAPEPEGAPRKSAVTKLIEQTTGVRKPVVKLQVSESAALKKQIQLKAREARETRKARKEAAEELAKSITDYVKANPIRGPINSRQAMSITKKALKLDVNNEAAVDRFEMYVERVIENANYDRDLADARALIKRAKAFAKSKDTQGNVKTTLEAIANVAPTLLDNPFEFNLVVQRYLLGLAPVTAKQYAVMPDADVRRYLESLETQIKDNQEVLDRSKAQRILDKQAAYAEEKGIPLDEAIAILNSEEFLQEKTIEKLEDLTKLLTAMAQESQKDVKAYDDAGATPKQKELISFMRKVNLDSLINEEKKRYIRFANNLLANGATFGMEQFQSIALGQEAAMKAAKDRRLSNKLSAWISPIGGDKAIDTARRIAAKTQSEADTFKNIFGREAVGAFRNILGLNRLDVAQTDSNRAKEQIANEFGEYFKGLRKKYGDDATGFEAKGYAGIAGYLIQTDGNKTEAESIPYRRRLMEQNIVELRKSDKQADLAEADLKERALAQLTGTTNAEILSQLRALNPASYEQLMWVKDVMLPKWRDFLKEHDENFRNQANNYNNPDHLTITYKFPEGQLLPSEMEDVYQQDMIGMRIKQAANSIKRKDHPNLPVSKAGTIANIDINFGYNQYNALVDQVDKAFVAPAWEQVVAFTKAPEFEQVMGGRANALFVKNLLRDIQTSRSRQSLTDDEAQLIAGGVRLARKISTQAVLGGITQPLRQVPDQLAKLFFTTGRFDLITKNLLTTAQAAPLLNKFPIGRRGDAQAGTQYASQFSELARKVEASVTDRKWAKYRELMNKVGEFWMTPLRGSDVWAAKVSWMSYYEAELNKKGIKMESWEREAELVDTDQDRKEAAAYAEFAVDFYGGASDPTKMAALSKQSNNGWKEFAKLVFLPLNSFALQQKNSLISDLRDAYLRTGDRKASIAAIAGTLAGMAAFHGMRIYIIGGLIYPAGKALLMGIFGIDMDEPDEEEKQKQLEDNWRKFKASMYGNIIAGGAGEFAEKAAIDAVNRTAYLWDANINPDSLLNDRGEIMSFRQYEKEVSPLYRFRSYGSSEYSFGLADVLTEQATHALAETQQLMTPDEMEKYTGNEQAYAAFATGVEWMYFFRLMDTDVKRIATDLKRQMDKEVTERESELKRIREGR